MTERQRYILRVRTLAAVAEAYFASAKLGFPGLKTKKDAAMNAKRC